MFDFLFSKAHAQFGTSIGTKATETSSKTTSGVTSFFETIVEKLPGWIAGTVVIFLAFLVAGLCRKIVINKVSEHLEDENQAILILVGRTTYVGVLSVGLAIGLSFWGVKIDALLAAFGIGVAFALRDIMVNFIAGVLILISRQFRIGDFIQVGSDIKGKVVEIQSRATILKGLDGTKIIVPNKDIFNKKVISFTTNAFRRIDVVVGVDYRTNLELASKIVMSILENQKKILPDPKPSVIINDFGESSINLKAKFWVETGSPWVKIKSQVLEDIQKNFQTAKITIPWPIRTVIYDKDSPASQGEEIDLPKPQFDEPKIKDFTDDNQEQTGAQFAATLGGTGEPEAHLEPEPAVAAIAEVPAEPVVSPPVEAPAPAPTEPAEPKEPVAPQAAVPAEPAVPTEPTSPVETPATPEPETPPQSVEEPTKEEEAKKEAAAPESPAPAEEAKKEEEIPSKPKADDSGASFLSQQ